MGSENVLEHIWQYLNHRGLSKSCKALKKEASLSGKVDAVMLGTVLSRLETPKVETTLEPKEIESAQESSEIIKEKVDKKSKKSKSDSKKSKTESKKSKTVETSVVDEDTATLVSGLTEIINSDAIEQQSQFNDDDESNGKITKKRKIEQVEQVEEPSRSEKAINNRFSRIYRDEFDFAKDELKNNNFMAKGGAVGSYGHKAHQDLIVTRGKGFRKEKDKKKRGSYRGGRIDFQSHSIKFED